MKRIILKQEKPTISAHDVSYIPHPIVGAKHTNHGSKQKAFVVMTEYMNINSYKLMCVNRFEAGNQHDSPEYSGTLENIFKLFGYDFYLFETPAELFKWLSE
jgi:hypothetical protein